MSNLSIENNITLNGVNIPEFNNFDEVVEFVDKHSDKLYINFLEGDRKFERNAILSKDESENTEYTEIGTTHCVRCMAISESIQYDEICENCDEYEDEF